MNVLFWPRNQKGESSQAWRVIYRTFGFIGAIIQCDLHKLFLSHITVHVHAKRGNTGGGHLYFKVDIIRGKRLSESTLNTYFSKCENIP